MKNPECTALADTKINQSPINDRKKNSREEEASRVIQSFWRRKSFFTQFLCLLEATAIEINQGYYNNLFNKMLKYCVMLDAYFVLEIKRDETTESGLHIFRTRDGKPLKNSKVTLDLQSKAHGFTEEDLKTLQMTIKQKSTLMRTSTEKAVLFSKLLALCGYDLHVKTCLKMIAHAVFTPPYKNRLQSSDKILGYLKDILVFLFSDKKSLSVDILRILKDAFAIVSSSAVKVTYTDDKRLQQIDLAEFKKKQTADNESTYWGELDGVKPTDIITVAHSGGYQCIHGFIYRKKPGYLLEGDAGLGLQVTPLDGKLSVKEVSRTMACRYFGRNVGSIQAYDDHALLVAYIEAQYLLPANNGYEAGLRPEAVPHLTGITIKKLYCGDKEVNYFLQYSYSKVALFSPYSGTSDTQQLSRRCQASLKKVENNFRASLRLRGLE